MTWTKNRPEKTGYFWLEFQNCGPTIAQIACYGITQELKVRIFQWENPAPIDAWVFDDAWWMGPLEYPEDHIKIDPRSY